MKVIFLDFDGVLNGDVSSEDIHAMHAAAKVKDLDTVSRLGLNPVLVERIDRICRATGASVVFSTGWRSSFTHDELVTMLRMRGLTAEVVDSTPQFGPERMSEYPPTTRTREIKAWLSRHAGVTRWLAIDDMGLKLAHFLQTDDRAGITEAGVEMAILMLGEVTP